jgi:DnaJ-class molecular chaperone
VDIKVIEALKNLEFEDPEILPKLKEIRKRYMKLSFIHHPDRNHGSKESTARFQKLLNAYQTAGKACENTIYEDDSDEDEMARKMFKQFSFSAVKENLNSFTIKTEKTLNAIWKEILCANFGQPQDLKAHGLKYNVDDTCNNEPAKLYLPLYRTGKLLIQARSNDHSVSVHFVNDHLETLYTQVYNKKKLQKTLAHKTPVTKHTGGKTVSKVHKCLKCGFHP